MDEFVPGSTETSGLEMIVLVLAAGFFLFEQCTWFESEDSDPTSQQVLGQ